MSLNLATILETSARAYPERIALKYDSREITYRQLDLQAKSVARGLIELEVRKDSRVALMIPNIPEFTIAYFGILYAGATVVVINPLAAKQEVSFFLEDSEAEVLIADSSCLADAVAAAVSAKIPVCTAGQLDPAADGSLARWGLIGRAADTAPGDTAAILYTSGTTGRPKGAELTHANLLINATVMIPRVLYQLPDPYVALAALPLFHCFGQNVIQNTTLALGGTMTLVERFEADRVWEVLKRDRVHLYAGVPTMYIGLLKDPPRENAYLPDLRHCMTGGAPFPVEVLEAWWELTGRVVYEGYGLSETSPPSCHMIPEIPWKPGSVGVPTWGSEMSIQDGQGNEIDGPGEVCIRGWGIFKGYLNRPEATAEVIDSRGWFHSGDIGRRDSDGAYWILDRIKSMILRGGYNVYPREVEDVLYQHPAVAEAAVMGIPHERLGEEVKAAVSFYPGKAVPEDELRKWCRERLSAYKYPRVFELRDELPQGATGKIQKRDL